jgi:transcriptional regulator with XRE-family HTH domain
MPRKQTDPLDIEVGRKVRALRLERNMSQEKLGDALGLTFQQVQKYEKGANRISAGRLQRIAEILGVPTTAFFADASSVYEPPNGSRATEPAEPRACCVPMRAFRACR